MVRITKYQNDQIRNKAINILRSLSDKNKLTGDELALIGAFIIIERAENTKLKQYENLEEQGLLLRLPCKVGHKVYTINCSYDCKHDFDCIEIEEFKCEAGLRCKYQRKEYSVVETEFQVPKIAALGETVFLTLEEAEQALKEMKEHG